MKSQKQSFEGKGYQTLNDPDKKRNPEVCKIKKELKKRGLF